MQVYLCFTRQPPPPWRSQQSPSQRDPVDLLASLDHTRVLNFVAQSQQRVHVPQIEAIFGPVGRSTGARGLFHSGTSPGVMADTCHQRSTTWAHIRCDMVSEEQAKRRVHARTDESRTTLDGFRLYFVFVAWLFISESEPGSLVDLLLYKPR